jgi:hypothetical protein
VDPSGGTLVFMDDAAEDVAAHDNTAVRGARAGEWRLELETAVGPGFVVMANVLGENDLEMSLRDNQEVIETVLSDVKGPKTGAGGC